MNTRPLNVIILAAGKGTRMRSQLPKVLHEVGNKPILQHVIDVAQSLEPTKIIVVYGYEGEQVRAQLSDASVEWIEQKEQLGTGHAVKQTLEALEDDANTLILLGDVPLLEKKMCVDLLSAAETGLSILSCNKSDATGYGRIVREDGEVQAIIEHKDATPAQRKINEVNTGIMAMPAKMLKNWLLRINNDNAQKEYYLTDIVSLAVMDEVTVEATAIDNEWAVTGVNSKVDLAAVERAYQRKQANELMVAGVTIKDANRIDVRGNLIVGKDVTIDVGCIFEGDVEIGDGVSIGPYCVIKNSTIAANTTVAAYSHFEQSMVGESCRVGPYARLRPGASLIANNHIGNFVEIKNSTVNEGSKINHLSYVGDASVGKAVNIGAGAITCNYDGANKFKTVIEDNVFVGSDTQLIAPVTVRKGTTIAAGSTITRDTEEDSLAICRSRDQLSIKGWQRPVKQKKDS